MAEQEKKTPEEQRAERQQRQAAKDPVQRARKNVEPGFMSKVMDKMAANPGLLMAGASILGNMDAGQAAKYAVMFYAGYKIYSKHMEKTQNKQQAEANGQNTSRFAVAKGKVLGAVNGARTFVNTARTTANQVAAENDRYNAERRLEHVSERAQSRINQQVNPHLGASPAQVETFINRAAPMQNTPTFQRVMEDPKTAARYMSHLANEAEHEMAWDDLRHHLQSKGIEDLKDLRFIVCDDSTTPDPKTNQVSAREVFPYAKLKDMPQGTPEEKMAYSQEKARIDKAVMDSVDHGHITFVDSYGFECRGPNDAYNANLSQMDADRAYFAGVTEKIKSEQLSAYQSLREHEPARMDAMTPKGVEHAAGTAFFEGIAEESLINRASTAAREREAYQHTAVSPQDLQAREWIRDSVPIQIQLEDQPAPGKRGTIDTSKAAFFADTDAYRHAAERGAAQAAERSGKQAGDREVYEADFEDITFTDGAPQDGKAASQSEAPRPDAPQPAAPGGDGGPGKDESESDWRDILDEINEALDAYERVHGPSEGQSEFSVDA